VLAFKVNVQLSIDQRCANPPSRRRRPADRQGLSLQIRAARNRAWLQPAPPHADWDMHRIGWITQHRHTRQRLGHVLEQLEPLLQPTRSPPWAAMPITQVNQLDSPGLGVGDNNLLHGFDEQLFGVDEQVPLTATTPLKKCSALCSPAEREGPNLRCALP
jgi:hypothetical protein